MHTRVAKTNSITDTNVFFIIMNISMEDIHLRKGEILGFLELTDMNSNDLTTETFYQAVFQDKDPMSDVESDSINYNENSMGVRNLLLLQQTLKCQIKQI